MMARGLLSTRFPGGKAMKKVRMVEVSGQWVVIVEKHEGRFEEYQCESQDQARRWLNLLGAPIRTNPMLKGRAAS